MSTQNPAEIEALKQAIQLSRIERAKAMPREEKLLEGARLFDMVRARMLDGIRNQFPSWTEDQVCQEFRRQLDIQRRREERGIYQVVGFIEDGVRE